ncbi:hypothetical protein BOTCAL_0077g00180 [Botryotinia calthae]|uniref:Uncharacterized protein n=1 Tax=Botryotinia calthae TaxID=38488 RepID=A0A4Y8DAN8_9HELO|nr:hypothetical protein BOTCAL_0077g00180 [Botryotinia calthae]
MAAVSLDFNPHEVLPTSWVWGPGRSTYERFLRKATYDMSKSKDGNGLNGAVNSTNMKRYRNRIFCATYIQMT